MGTIKFSVNRKKLIEVIQLAHDTAKQSKVLPVLSKVLIEVSATNLRVTANNLVNMVSLTVDYSNGNGDIDTWVVLDGDSLLGVLKIGNAEEVALTIKSGEYITIGKSKIKNFVDRDEFPISRKLEGLGTTVKSKDLANALGAVKHCAATEESRPILAGLHLKFSENILDVAGADGYVLGYTRVAVDAVKPFSLTLPIKAIAEMRKFLNRSDETVSVYANGWFVITSGENQFGTALIEGNYPDFNMIMKNINASYTQIEFDTETLQELINNVKLCNNFTEKNVPVKLSLTEGLLAVSGEGENGSHVGEIELEFPYKGDVKVALNPKYFEQALAQLEQCVFKVKDASSPVGLSHGNTQYVIMPVHLGKGE